MKVRYLVTYKMYDFDCTLVHMDLWDGPIDNCYNDLFNPDQVWVIKIEKQYLIGTRVINTEVVEKNKILTWK